MSRKGHNFGGRICKKCNKIHKCNKRPDLAEYNKSLKQRELVRRNNTGRKRPDLAEYNLKYKSEQIKLDKNPNWRGGKSFEPYGLEWTKTLRKAIRERDNYVCQLCNKIQTDSVFSVHHIDYDKKNNNPNNLITLCRNCHIKTSFNQEYWREYFLKIKR